MVEVLEKNLEDIRNAVNSWRTFRLTTTRFDDSSPGAATRSLNEFVASMNAMTRRLMAAFGENDPEFYSALAELANNAETHATKGATVKVNHRDVTDLGRD